MARDAQINNGPNGEESKRPRPLAHSVLQLIWREREISRAEIARQTDLSRSTVSEIVTMLLATGLVAETGTGPSRGGRRPIVLEFQDDACLLLGVEMGAAHVAVVLTNLRGKVLAWKQRSHPVRSDPLGTRALIERLCDACLDTTPPAREKLVGLGIAVACPVDPVDPDSLSEIVLPDWKGRSGFDVFADRYGVPVFVDNDANLGALAEHWWGSGKNVDNFAYIKVGTGVGSGHVIDGEIYRGATGVAGEIGHLAIDPQGGPCLCGLRGCLTTFVGAQALEERGEKLLADFPDSALAGSPVTIDAIEDAALAGDPLALQLTREAGEYLGIAIAGMLNLMNPATVILGGGMARLGELLLSTIRGTVRRRTLVGSVASSEIRTSELGLQAIAIGAATMVLKAALDDARLFSTATRASEAR